MKDMTLACMYIKVICLVKLCDITTKIQKRFILKASMKCCLIIFCALHMNWKS